MGIAPNNTFTFDGVSSSTYGVYLTGEGVFNAPERAVEMLSIPGRNGNYALDQGNFNNISVTYKVGMFDVDESNFATKVSNFRNWLCSKVGYVRLTDTYNTGEYRMAVYKSGLELDHKLLVAGEAEITFDCKPQRFLTSGETAVTVANNGTINNPTLFDSHPLLEIAGYGDFNIGGERITINTNGEAYGELLLANKTYNKDVPNREYASILDSNNYGLLLTGDDINVMSGSTILVEVMRISDPTTVSFGSVSVNGGNLQGSVSLVYSDSKFFRIAVTVDSFGFVKGTSATHTITLSLAFSYTVGGTTTNWSGTMPIEFKYNGTANKITYNIGTCTPAFPLSGVADAINYNSFISSVYGNSTRLMSGTTYIDLDIGEAYMIQNNNVVSINNMVILPAELPTLASGNNTITYDNTISSFKVTPRWWKV